MSDLDVSTPRDSAPPPDPTRGWFRALILRLHFYVGIFIGPFILVAAISGTLYAVAPQLDELIYDDQLSSRTSGSPLPLADQVAAAEKVLPGLSVHAVRPAPGPGETTRVMFADEHLESSETRTVFVDPATGDSQGVLVTYGTTGSLPARTWLSNLHRSLHLGEVGRLYSELAASWLWVLALSGLGLWITARRAGPRRSNTARSARARSRTRHSRLGLLALVGMLGLSVTGLTWSAHAGGTIAQVRAELSWLAPTVDTGGPPSDGHDHHAHHGSHSAADELLNIDDVLDAAREGGIDSNRVEIARPSEPGAAWTVTEIDRGWPTQVDAVAVDPASMAVTDSVRFADYPLMAKLAQWGIDAHMGTLFGLLNQVVLAALGLALVVLVVLGYRMFWQRRPTRRDHFRLPRAYPRGALRRAPVPAVVGVAAVTLILGWAMPVLGVSLLAFLAVDVVLAHRGRSRALG